MVGFRVFDVGLLIVWLIWFFRLMALFQLSKGLVHWGLLIMDSSNTVGLIPSASPNFLD